MLLNFLIPLSGTSLSNISPSTNWITLPYLSGLYLQAEHQRLAYLRLLIDNQKHIIHDTNNNKNNLVTNSQQQDPNPRQSMNINNNLQ